MEVSMIKNALYWQWLAIIGLLGLIVLIIVWNGWLSTPEFLPRPIEFAIFLLPLAFLSKGVLHGVTAVHAYASFTALFYVLFGFWFLFTPSEEPYGAGLLFFGFLLYLGSFMYARLTMVKPEQNK
jgi:uncharacterized membrane protein